MKCYICGKTLTKSQNTKDHVIPRSLWDTLLAHDYDEVRRFDILPCCAKCNESKDSAILLLPTADYNWWPNEYWQQLETLRLPMQVLIRKLLKHNLVTIRNIEKLEEWLKSCGSPLTRHDFDEEPVYVPLKEIPKELIL